MRAIIVVALCAPHRCASRRAVAPSGCSFVMRGVACRCDPAAVEPGWSCCGALALRVRRCSACADLRVQPFPAVHVSPCKLAPVDPRSASRVSNRKGLTWCAIAKTSRAPGERCFLRLARAYVQYFVTAIVLCGFLGLGHHGPCEFVRGGHWLTAYRFPGRFFLISRPRGRGRGTRARGPSFRFFPAHMHAPRVDLCEARPRGGTSRFAREANEMYAPVETKLSKLIMGPSRQCHCP